MLEVTVYAGCRVEQGTHRGGGGRRIVGNCGQIVGNCGQIVGNCVQIVCKLSLRIDVRISEHMFIYSHKHIDTICTHEHT